MPARILAYGTSLLALLREIQYTLARASNEPLAAAFVTTFQSHRQGWQTVLLAEIACLDELAIAQAAVNKADQGIDGFAGRTSRAVDDHTDGPTRKQIRTWCDAQGLQFDNNLLARVRSDLGLSAERTP